MKIEPLFRIADDEASALAAALADIRGVIAARDSLGSRASESAWP